MILTSKTKRETDGRWIAEVPWLPGMIAYGATESEAVAAAEGLAMKVLTNLSQPCEHAE
jgi:predicted RNase H-like HicB family nuclease